MNNRYFKIFVCVLMVCCLLFSFTVQCYAAMPMEIGDFGGAITSIIAYSMGVDYDYREFSQEGLNKFFNVVNKLSNPVWVWKQELGMMTIAMDNEATQALAQLAADNFLTYNIQSNTSGQAYSGTVATFDGHEFYQNGNYLITSSFGDGIIYSGRIGETQTLGNSVASVSFVQISDNQAIFSFYYNGQLINNQSAYWQSGWPPNPYSVVLSDFVGNVSVGLWQTNRVSRSSDTIGTAVTTTQSVNYTSDTIDTTVTQDIPSTGGMLLTFPCTATESMESIMEAFQDAVLNNSEYISYEYVDDVGKPVPYEQTIADTPWTDLAGTLDQIKQYLQNMHIAVSGTITSALDGISDAVGSIEGTIESADAGFIQGFLDNFMGVFRSAFDGVSSHLGIWHYVVSWIGSISSCFSWSLSALSSCGAIFSAPIYAVFAGTVVIAVYRRFGK